MRKETAPGQNNEELLHNEIEHCRYRFSLSGHEIWVYRIEVAKEKLRILRLAMERINENK